MLVDSRSHHRITYRIMRKLLSLTIVIFCCCSPALAANSPRAFGGVGIDGVPRADGSIVVKQVVLGGPAQQAGVRPGDVITRIDGAPTLGSNFKEMVEHRLRGQAGTPVELKVKRPGNPKALTFRLVRRQLALPGKQR